MLISFSKSKAFKYYHIRCCLVPYEFRRILVLKKFINNKIYVKIIPSNLLWTRSSFFTLIYDAIIIKQPSSYSFGKKVVKILKNKNHSCLVSSLILENFVRLGGLDNVEYGILLLIYQCAFSSTTKLSFSLFSNKAIWFSTLQ